MAAQVPRCTLDTAGEEHGRRRGDVGRYGAVALWQRPRRELRGGRARRGRENGQYRNTGNNKYAVLSLHPSPKLQTEPHELCEYSNCHINALYTRVSPCTKASALQYCSSTH